MINKETYKRLTGKTIGSFKYCLKYHKSKSGEFADYDAFFDYSMAIMRLGELEDKIESGLLVELPCKVGDTATAIIDTFLYDNSIQKVKIKGLAYIVEDENGDLTFQHISRIFPNEEQAEAKLKELQENKK